MSDSEAARDSEAKHWLRAISLRKPIIQKPVPTGTSRIASESAHPPITAASVIPTPNTPTSSTPMVPIDFNTQVNQAQAGQYVKNPYTAYGTNVILDGGFPNPVVTKVAKNWKIIAPDPAKSWWWGQGADGTGHSLGLRFYVTDHSTVPIAKWTKKISVNPGDYYQLAASILCHPGAAAQVAARFYDGSGVLLDTIVVAFSSQQWQNGQIPQHKVKNGVTYAEVTLEMIKGTAVSGVLTPGQVYFDNLVFCKVPVSALYTVGNVPSDAWRLADVSPYHCIEGYASAPSVNLGEPISFYVNTTDGYGNATASPFHIDVFRMGYYGGLGGALMMIIGRQPGAIQTFQFNRPGLFTSDGLSTVECQWIPSYTLQVPTDWPSGVYLAKLTLESPPAASAWDNYIIFVVRDDANQSALLFNCSVNTYQAYNYWGGKSLYGDDSGSFDNRSYAVSFNRPYDRGEGTGDFFFYEYSMIRWLEQNGYDVTYTTDVDIGNPANPLLSHKAFLVAGHAEYWSSQMRQNVENALQAGVSLGFFSANNLYWQVRQGQSQFGPGPTILCYKDATLDPMAGTPSVTVTWRDPLLNRPEQLVVGQMYAGWLDPANSFPICFKNTQTTYLWNPFASTNLVDGYNVDVGDGLINGEYDRIFPDQPLPATKGDTGVFKLAESSVYFYDQGQPPSIDTANVTLYTAPSGATVFAAGTFTWSWGLDDIDNISAGWTPWEARQRSHFLSNATIQQITTNVLARFLAGPLP